MQKSRQTKYYIKIICSILTLFVIHGITKLIFIAFHALETGASLAIPEPLTGQEREYLDEAQQ
jgi:hypothetical protein